MTDVAKDKSEEFRKMKEEAYQGLKEELGTGKPGGSDDDKDKPKPKEEEGNIPDPGKEDGDDHSDPGKETPEPKPDDTDDKQQDPKDDWKTLYEKERQRYSVLQGKYNKEIKELRDQVNDLLKTNESQVSTIQGLEAKLQQRPATEKTDSGETQDGQSRERTPKDELEKKLLEYAGGDPDFLKVMDEYVQGKLDSSTKDIKEKVDTMQSKTEQSELDRFRAEVKRSHPDLDELITDPLFHDFCKQYDKRSGYTFGQWLKAHDSNRNVEGIVEILNLYKDTDSYNSPDKTRKKPPISPTGKGNTGKGDKTSKGDGRSYTLKEFNDISIKNIKNYNNGKITKEKYDTMKEELRAAVTEGRVTG